MQLDWWREHVEAKGDALAVTNDKIAAAEEAKRLFMLKEGIKEEPDEQPRQPEVKVDPFTKEFREMVFEVQDNEEAAEAQRAMDIIHELCQQEECARQSLG